MRPKRRHSSWATSSAAWKFGSAELGKTVVIIGLLLVAFGLLMMAGFPLGRLPGDKTLRVGAVTFYFPLTSSILVSVVLTLVFSLLRR